jgi:hypothetical protein
MLRLSFGELYKQKLRIVRFIIKDYSKFFIFEKIKCNV